MEKISEDIQKMISQHLRVVETQIWNHAEELAANEQSDEVMPRHAFQAINDYAPGIKFTGPLVEKREVLRDIFTSTIGVSAILAVVFGAFGLIGFEAPANAGGEVVQALAEQKNAFIDIAKIFAGAVVGAAGASVATRKST